MAKKDEWYYVRVRKPNVRDLAALSFEVDCFRIGTHTGSGPPDWEYEIPFSEIVQIEDKAIRDVLRGRLRDGTEFDIRFRPHMNWAKAARRGKAQREALDRIPANISDGGSLRAVDGTKLSHTQDNGAEPGCLGCAGSVVVAVVPVLAILAAII